MIDRERLNAELRRLRELISSDAQVLKRVDRNGDGSIDGEEWECARRSVIARLENEVESAATVAVPVAGKLATQVYEQELRTAEPPEAPPQMDSTDHLILEWPIDLSLPRRQRPIGPPFEFTVRSGDRAELGGFERLTSLSHLDRRIGDRWQENEEYYSIRPTGGENVLVRRHPTFLGEALDVRSVCGRTIARVLPRVRLLKYAYRIEGEDDRTLLVERRPWNDDCERGFRRTGGERRRPRSRKSPDPYHLVNSEGRWVGFVDSALYFPNPEERKKYFRQWVIRLEGEALTPPLRWGLIGTLAFILKGPFMFRGWFWSIFRSRRH